MKLCIFSGTFNPIHNAHLNMANYALHNFGFEKIIFIPAYKPPHKVYDTDMSAHRFNMVKLAIQDNPNFGISDIEYQRETKSYTYLTIKELYRKYNVNDKINLIIGTDAFQEIENWYETDKLKNLVDFIVFTRDNKTIKLDYLKRKGYNFKLAGMDFLDISSTELRNKIKNGEDISDLVPPKVEDYIKENGLYEYKKMA